MPKTDTKSWLDNDTFAAWTFLSPALILLSIFIIWPIAYLFYLSFTAGSFTSSGTTWVGLRNYWRLLLTPDFWQVLGNTIYFTVATVIPSLVIPLALAVLLDKSLALRGLLRSAYFLPSIISLVAAGLGFRWLFQTDGPANAFLDFFGIAPIPWLGSTTWAMPVLIVLSIWKQLGFNMVVFLAGLQAIPPSRYEAAELDGANAWQQFWHVTLPGLQPTMIFATVTTAIFTLRSFEQVYVITGGGPLNSTNLLVYYIYQEAFAQFDFGYAAAAATVLLAFTLVFVYLQLQTWGDE
ncbi:sugar ABC transporter permease [Nodularia spumigena CS-584]|mgnify:FL=1|jgi:multiple sugar transport system permease protein|uniref:carbohydrate ABC transporter permease n=1 Tax=Nodularia spumigena TaxID=70799 RepID=UPI0000EAD2FF|nr:sugar ABC transporter permease [Nodularia spumigena]AHJ27897.1 sugar ABC transporter, permease protein [Nodularia spumigena CCY9414]EAW43885.1 Binding-protein-dependent transport systems inner membrane component [Nodularia spumigena CCY9414]MDB9359065.1 sugar ABC transporter permease [Nodularia spumigena CS-588/02]MDB9367173.1 sugar ABC transporter permease [Nodularia spumigena CS-588/02A10]MDB9382669.1 sugar ABC transporter permease [Nodularia spumigena CS-584]